MASILMRAATAGAQAAQLDGLPLTPETSAQIASAGMLGTGVARFEEALRLNVPFVLDPHKDSSTDIRPWRLRLNEAVMAEKAEDVLRRAYERSGAPTLDQTSLRFKALAAVHHIKQAILDHGLHIYSQKWLFDDSQPLERRLSLFQAMEVQPFGPHSASVAIAAGQMPPLPSYTIADYVRSLESWHQVTFSVPTDNLKTWIGAKKPYLVEFPAPKIEAGHMSRIDRYSKSAVAESIELGLGFFLLTLDEETDQSIVITPMLFGLRPKDKPSSSVVYRKNYQYQSYRGPSDSRHRQLVDLVRAAQHNKLARLDVCAKCGTVFSDNHPGLAHKSC